MKTWKSSLTLLVIIALTLGVQSCKKNKEDISDDDMAAQMEQSADESSQAIETEGALNDANEAMANSAFGKTFSIAGATIDSVIGDKKLIITYNGNNANGTRFRKGKIIVQLTSGDHWKDAGAELTITFVDFKVTRNGGNNQGKSITINGTHIITNVSGGLAGKLTPGTSVTHKMTGSMSVTFEDGKQRTWEIFRQRQIGLTEDGKGYVIVSGFGSIDGISNVVVKGTNRAGNSFYTVISTPVKFSSTCDWMPVSGVKTHKGISREITVTFGVDASGNPVDAPNCPYGFRINWTNARNVAKQVVISY